MNRIYNPIFICHRQCRLSGYGLWWFKHTVQWFLEIWSCQ